jgi:hypothetical protein
MISPSFALTATERVLPRMALDFTTASLDSRVTFARTGDTATVINSSGVIAAINANLPRFDFNPTTLVCRGLLIEEARTNLLLNSLLNGTSLSTQSVTTAAVSQTLSFYGTGQIVLTGTSSATVVGTGAYPARTTLTFTPTVGVLTLTVTGTVQYAQLEAGAFATSFIPTDGTTKTRNADVAVMTGTNFSSWYNASEGSFRISAALIKATSGTSRGLLRAFNSGDSGQRIAILVTLSGAPTLMVVSTTTQAQISSGTVSDNTVFNMCAGYKLDNFGISKDAAAVATDVSGTVSTGVNSMNVGLDSSATTYLNGWLSKLSYYPQKLITAEIQAFSKG